MTCGALASLCSLGCEPESQPPPPPHVCDAGEARCDQGLRELCVDNAFTLDPCAASEQCSGAGQCVCKDNSVRCGASGRERCEAGAFSDEPCPANAPVCAADGLCKACEVGTSRCDGGQREICNADQSWTSALCPADLPDCYGEGLCRACEPAATRCAADGWLERCASDGLAWQPEVCPIDAPVCVDGSCLPCAEAPPYCAPAVAGINPGNCYLELSLGMQTTHPLFCFTSGFTDADTILAGDVNADGRTDLILLEAQSVNVKLGQIGTFDLATTFWGGPHDTNARAHLAADFDGDGDDDLAEWTAGGARVWRSDGVSFAEPTSWTSTNFGIDGDRLAGDVDGDGDADLVAAASDKVEVALSDGASFATPSVWLLGPPAATRGYYLGDVDADGDADLIVWQDSTVHVARSSGSSFLAPTVWNTGPFFGLVNHVLDVDSDGQADLVVQNYDELLWRRSVGTAFEELPPLNLTPFLGAAANLTLPSVCIPNTLCL